MKSLDDCSSCGKFTIVSDIHLMCNKCFVEEKDVLRREKLDEIRVVKDKNKRINKIIRRIRLLEREIESIERE